MIAVLVIRFSHLQHGGVAVLRNGRLFCFAAQLVGVFGEDPTLGDDLVKAAVEAFYVIEVVTVEALKRGRRQWLLDADDAERRRAVVIEPRCREVLGTRDIELW